MGGGGGVPKRSGQDGSVYADANCRERLKSEITAGDKGGWPGQWSARKAQLLARAYEDAGGGYTSEERTEAQGHLVEWAEEEWTTADGEPAVRGEETARYLPKGTWEELTPAQRHATDARKRAGSRVGGQFVPNTAAAREARKATED